MIQKTRNYLRWDQIKVSEFMRVPTSYVCPFHELRFWPVKLKARNAILIRECVRMLSSCLDALQVHEHTDIDTALSTCG